MMMIRLLRMGIRMVGGMRMGIRVLPVGMKRVGIGMSSLISVAVMVTMVIVSRESPVLRLERMRIGLMGRLCKLAN